ncbi:anti-sigma factor antagonist [Ectothiorhodospiraceae bacterium BW-2]|nr:anti-sigma factor antagonist [Ectothiorhodospiraceae bacterium BW-2]
MTIQSQLDTSNKQLTIHVGQRFDFRVHREFRDCYTSTDGANSTYVINLENTTYMDSSALGMLLLLREHSGGETSRLILRKVKPELMKILRISNFDQLFTIENG